MVFGDDTISPRWGRSVITEVAKIAKTSIKENEPGAAKITRIGGECRRKLEDSGKQGDATADNSYPYMFRNAVSAVTEYLTLQWENGEPW